MKCLSRAYRSELAGLILLTIAFTPLVVQADDLGLDKVVPTFRKAVARKTQEVQTARGIEHREEILLAQAPAADPFGDVVQFAAPRLEVAPAAAEKEAIKDAAEDAGDKADDAADEEVSIPREPAEEVDPLVIRFHLMDGSMISGKLTVDQINVTTEFGELVVPIPNLVSFKPGLDSYPSISDEIDTLIQDLGSDDYQTRENSHKELARRGMKVHKQLLAKKDDENAERKRHVGQLLKDLETLAEEQEILEEEGEEVTQAWVRDDTVVTNKFTVVGKISPREFVIETKFGPLSMQLSDIKMMDREKSSRDPVLRRVTVQGTNLAQVSYKETGIRVEAGDKVSFTAEGQLVMSPWGSSNTSTPDGGQNYGWYIPEKIPGGCLIGKIGNSGEEFKIGSKHSFVSKRSGVLRLAIGMQAQYARQGYNFPGQYNVRVKVESP